MRSEEAITRIVAFLERIGIAVYVERAAGTSPIPGASIRDGALLFDPALPYPGDLLHEAGHIAVTDPALRPTLRVPPRDAAEEMAAIAWSYAAALAAGIDPTLVFHAHGYRGGGDYLIAAMEGGGGPGVPMLQYYGMTANSRDAGALARAAFPQMSRWLR
jgi:hypothetical protein